MATYSGRSAVIALGKQASEGTPLASPKLELPMGSGWAGFDRSIQPLPWTDESQDSIGSFVERNSGRVDLTVPLLPVSSVAFFQSVMGTRTTTGAGPYSHELTMADALGWYTWFYAQPGANYWVVSDAKTDSWQVSWSPGQPLEGTVSAIGKTVTRSGSKWSAATLDEAVEPFFTYIGATVKFDAEATPATTTVSNIAGGSITCSRNLDPIQTDDIGYQYIPEQNREIAISLDDTVFENNDLINTVFSGTTTGTTQSGDPVYGAIELKFLGSDQAAAATRSLTIVIPRVEWAIDQIPGADPSGATVRYTVTGSAKKPTSGSIMTATVINANAGTTVY